jgi:copper chaperone CopZ
MARIVLHIEGMSCGHCLNAVSQALAGAPGVSVDSVRIGRAEVEYDERVTSAEAVAAAVAKAGYSATPQESRAAG